MRKVAIVTGASSGIGWSLAKELSRRGYAVGVVARRKEKLEKLVREIEAASGVAAMVDANVGERQSAVTAIRDLQARLGPVDLLVANAGVGKPTLFDPVNTADVEQMIQVNLLGVVYAIEAVLPGMLKRGQGHLAAVSSLAAYKGLPGESGYCASKAAVNSYLEGLRIQLREKGIQVTTICPGFVLTPMTEINDFHMPGLMSADRAARLIARALEKRKKVFNFPLQTTLLMKLTRWLPDWLVAKAMGKYNENPPFPKETVGG